LFGSQPETLFDFWTILLKEGQLQFLGCFCLEREGYWLEEQDCIPATRIAAKVSKNNFPFRVCRMDFSTA
jgi:hypothetical protein